jgi:hypothetical protein
MTELLEVRKQFEEWCREVMFCDPEHLERLTGGSYRVHNVQYWWMGWEAALSRSGEPTAFPKHQYESLVWFINEVSDWAQKHPDDDAKSSEMYAYAEGAAENLAEIREALDSRSAPERQPLQALVSYFNFLAALGRRAKTVAYAGDAEQYVNAVINNLDEVDEILPDSLNRPLIERIKLLLARANREALLAVELRQQLDAYTSVRPEEEKLS